MSIPRNYIDELLQKTDIVSVISRYVQLNSKGKQFWGLCPFHGEKTPSFAVSQSEQFYHCFGCKESGNVISFVMKMENCSFIDAIKILSEWAGMKVPESQDFQEDEALSKLKKECLSALKDCAHYYYDCLNSDKGAPGREYLEKRGVSEKIARLFGLGYCPDFDSTKKVLNQKGYSDSVLLEAGIIKRNENGTYDPMGGRVVFPVINIYSEVLAFTGRTLQSKVDHAKYLNTAETKVYSKGKNLYALNLVKKYKKAGQKFDYFILCEGNMDVVSLHRAGFGMAVAGMGTALTTDQAKLIKRFVDKVYICYDGDTAGKKATMRGLDILKDQGLDVFVMQLPEGKDPDDVIKYDGRSAFEKLISEALPLVEYRIRTLIHDFDISSFDGKTKFATAAIGVLKELKNEVEKQTYLALVQEISGINKDFLRRQLVSENVQIVENDQEKSAERKEEKAQNIKKAEKFVLTCAYHKICTNELNAAKGKIAYFNEMFSPAAQAILSDILSGVSSSELLEKYSDYANVIGEIIVMEDLPNAKNELMDCIVALQDDYLNKMQNELNEKIALEPEKEKRQQLLIKLNEITKERKFNKK